VGKHKKTRLPELSGYLGHLQCVLTWNNVA